MKRIGHYAVGLAQGTTEMFSSFADGGEMWTGQGPRLEQVTVTFDESFAEPPIVHVGLSMWDIDRAANQRADIRAEDVTTTGFVLEFRTWGDTRVARVRANWLAIGPLRHEDDFAAD